MALAGASELARGNVGAAAVWLGRAITNASRAPQADIIAVRGDVLRYINLLREVDLVIKRGVRYK